MKIALSTYILGISLFITLSACYMNDDLLPSQLGPWSLSTDTIYTPANLYDYINGGAELYISYGFKKVVSKSYSAENQPDILVDIFDMNSPKDAYGVFMYSAENVSGLVGQGTQLSKGAMLFWMDHYFVSILAWPETPESKETMMKIARTIEKGIGKTGELPGIIDILPEKGLDRMSIRYFHHYAWLNSHYYIASENILLIEDDTEAVIAKYGESDHQSILLVIEYPSGEKTAEASGNFIGNYLPELQGNRFLQVEDGTYTGIDRENNTLIIVFNASSGNDIETLFKSVKDKIQSKQL